MNLDPKYLIKQLEETIANTGVRSRYVVNDNITTSDLCFFAAKELLYNIGIQSTDIDALIFVSQTPDYRLPATACLLQHKLKCRKDIIAFDMNLGCSGYVYGLGISHNMLMQPTINRVLLLVGDTPSKFVSNEDKSTTLLFGDGGSATLIEKLGDQRSYFSMSSDGSGADALIIPSGGYRNPSSVNTLIRNSYSNGKRSQEQLFMDGAEIFNFTIREIPKDIRGLLNFANLSDEDIDFYIFHQANLFIISYIARKLKISQEKYLLSIIDFGNTSSASIPITLTANIEKLKTNNRLIISGFGVGFSWSSAIISIDSCNVFPIQFI